MKDAERSIDTASHGKKASGRQEWLKYLNGGTLTIAQAVKAKCFDCMGGYRDRKEVCTVESCALFPFMAYNPKRQKRVSTMSDEQRQAVGERLRGIRNAAG